MSTLGTSSSCFHDCAKSAPASAHDLFSRGRNNTQTLVRDAYYIKRSTGHANVHLDPSDIISQGR
jgi:hypothetical protein